MEVTTQSRRRGRPALGAIWSQGTTFDRASLLGLRRRRKAAISIRRICENIQDGFSTASHGRWSVSSSLMSVFRDGTQSAWRMARSFEIPRSLRALVRARESSLILLGGGVGALAGLLVAAMSL